MKKHFLLLIAALFISNIVQCQFTKAYTLQNRLGAHFPVNMVSTSDEGFVYATASSNDELYFVRMNSDGAVLWSRKFEGLYNESSNGIIESSNGDFFISATLRDSNALNLNARHRLYKIDSDGSLVWTKDIQRTSDMVQSGAIVEVENNLFVLGNYMDESNNYCMSITKMDLDGEVHWQKTYRDPTIHLWCRDAVVTNDNQIVISGRAHHHGFISKIDQDGTVQWHKKIMEGIYFRIEDLVLTADNKILIAGTNRESNDCLISYHPFAASYDLDGEQLWGQHYENLIVSEFGSSINPALDGGYIITTSRREYLNSSTWYGQLIKTDNNGAFQWSKTLRPDHFSMQFSSVMSPEGKLTILGIDGVNYDESSRIMITQTTSAFETTCDQLNTSYINISFSSGTFSSLIVNDFSMINNVAQNMHTVEITGDYLCSTASITAPTIENTDNFNSYPNPTSGIIHFSKIPKEIVVYNLTGEIIFRDIGKSKIDLNQLPPAVYIIEQKFETNTIIERIIIN